MRNRSLLPFAILSVWVWLFFAPFNARAFAPGDANGDGAVRVDDVIVVLRQTVQLPGRMKSTTNADLSPLRETGLTGDGEIDVEDAISSLRANVGLLDLSEHDGVRKPLLRPALSFDLSATASTYGIADTVPFTVTLRNDTGADLTYMASIGCEVDILATDSVGAESWVTYACDTPVVEHTLKAGEEKHWAYDWTPPAQGGYPRRSGPYSVLARLDWMSASTDVSFNEKERLAYLTGGKLQLSDPPWAGLVPGFLAEISGDLPDPSWAYERTDMRVAGDTVYLYPVIRQTGQGGAPDVLVPFTTPWVPVRGDGIVYGRTYTVIVVGQDATLTGIYKT